MTETELQNTLLAMFENLLDARDEIDGDVDDITLAEIVRDAVIDLDGLAQAETFESAQLLTGNKGLVLRMTNGSEFQISIVQRR